MKTLNLYTSNRLEILVEKLADSVRRPLASPLDKEVIVVQSNGMKRWVSLSLARRHGICANCRFPLPNAFVYEIFKKVWPDLGDDSRFTPKIMTWRIMGLLPEFVRKPGFESLRTYLGDTTHGLKSLQLAERIADTFDQYLLFRPEMVLKWEKGAEDHWQAVLWRELAKGEKLAHRAALGKDFVQAVKTPSAWKDDMPERISIFGISALPGFHMEVIAAISRYCEVNLFLMNPCALYWGDILSNPEIKARTAKKGASGPVREELYLEKGNSLLASMGRLGRDFFDLICGFESTETDDFRDTGADDLLSCIQSDILNLRDREDISFEKKILDENDTSIQIHSCHSPMREIEALQDALCDMFEKEPDLKPADILVMTPDIETCAPYVQAVFDLVPGDPRKIPFAVADQSIRRQSRIVDTFMAICDLAGGRFGASEVLGVLESQGVRRKFGIPEPDLELVGRWVKETRIRWGIDGKSRGRIGLPDFAENTWKAGLERLLLGYAMPGGNEKMFAGILPYDHVEGSDALTLGRFLEFTDQIFASARSLRGRYTIDRWSQILADILGRFFAPDEDTEKETQSVRKTLNDLSEIRDHSGFAEEVGIDVIKHYMKECFENQGFGFGFIAGGITFCAMLPMRSIPFKVICLLGMNMDAYPRQSRPLSFDLIAKDPKPGDRSRRNDDRYLFLETLLSARKRLYISYVGQSIRDNSTIPPSVLVSELCDYIDSGFQLPADKEEKVLDRILVRHRLQAFSPEYFSKESRLFSYSEENCRAARCVVGPRSKATSFIPEGISEPDQEFKEVSLANLCAFFRNPAEFLLNRRLGIYLKEADSIIEEKEPFDVKGLDEYMFNEFLAEARLKGRDLAEYMAVKKASGELPHGAVGECTYQRLTRDVEGFVKNTEARIKGTPLEPLQIDLDVSGFRLTGRIDDIYPDRLIRYRCASIKSKDRIRIWIDHIALNSLSAGGYPRESLIMGAKKSVWEACEYLPVEKGKDVLGTLLEIYWQGLSRPVHFFPESCLGYAESVFKKNKTPADAVGTARNIWIKERGHSESDNAYYELCFANTDPLDLEFQRLAEEVFGPLLEHERKIS
jgi:exodeoxyribonuclease V gamma subunit